MTQAVQKYVGAWTVWFMAGHDHPYPTTELHNLNTDERSQARDIIDQIKAILIKNMIITNQPGMVTDEIVHHFLG